MLLRDVFKATMNSGISNYNAALHGTDRQICDALRTLLDRHLPDAESKVWHAHPVWFLDGNPIVGYSTMKDGVRLMFWSGQSFAEPSLKPEGSFKAAEIRYSAPDQIIESEIVRWIEKSKTIQWDYKNIVKRRGVLKRLV